MAGKEFSFEAVNHLAVLGEKGGYTNELNIVSYSGAAPKYDIRRWYMGTPRKGVTLSVDEIIKLRDALNALNFAEE